MAPCDPCRFVARLNRRVRSRLGGVRKGGSRPAKQKTRKTTPCTVAKCLKSQLRKWCEIASCGIAEIYCAVGQNRRMMASWQGVLRECPCAKKPDGLGAMAGLGSACFLMILRVTCVAGWTLQG